LISFHFIVEETTISYRKLYEKLLVCHMDLNLSPYLTLVPALPTFRKQFKLVTIAEILECEWRQSMSNDCQFIVHHYK